MMEKAFVHAALARKEKAQDSSVSVLGQSVQRKGGGEL
jgi:hypothetical protein